MSRKSVEFTELKETVKVTLFTKSPEKYIMIDRETGNMFVGKETGEWELILQGPNRNG